MRSANWSAAFLLLARAVPAAAAPTLAAPDFLWSPFNDGVNQYSAEREIRFALHNGPPASLNPSDSPTASGYGQVRVTLEDDCPVAFDVDVTICRAPNDCDTVTLDPNVPGRETGMPKAMFAHVESVTAVHATVGTNWCSSVLLEWVEGHQQEMIVRSVVNELDQSECDSGDYEVWFNGQPAVVGWCAAKGTCEAYLGPADPSSPCPTPPSTTWMYYPSLVLAPPAAEPPHSDHYLWAWRYPLTEFETPTLTPEFTTAGILAWVKSTLPYGEAFFYPENTEVDHEVRYLLQELAYTGGGSDEVVDRSRVTYWQESTGHWVWFDGNEAVPGASSTLSQRGLDRHEPSHLAMLAYPSMSAFNASMHDEALSATPLERIFAGNGASVLVSDLDDPGYWTKRNPGDPEWEGYRAYDDIFAAARTSYDLFRAQMTGCLAAGPPPLVAACRNLVRGSHCVKKAPKPEHFYVVVEGIESEFDAGVDPALSSDIVSFVNLSFESPSNVDADVRIGGTEGTMTADLIPYTRVEYFKACPLLPHPLPRYLADFTGGGADDWKGWARCDTMTVLLATIVGDADHSLAPIDEEIDVNWSGGSGFGATSPATVGISPTESGGCGEVWLQPNVRNALTLWQPTIEGIVEHVWSVSPSQDEALKRLLSPLHVGLEEPTSVPAGTPPYALYPTEWYLLEANVEHTPLDLARFGASFADGLYVPYMTRTKPRSPTPFGWLWPCFALGSNCGGPNGDDWVHGDPPTGGVTSAGDAFDVSFELRTELINQVLWAQAADPALLGNSAAHRVLDVPTDALATAAFGSPLASDLFDSAGPLEIHVFATVPPSVRLTDALGDWRMLLTAPQIVVELRTLGAKKALFARFLVDVLDDDFQVEGIRADLRLVADLSGEEQVFWTTTSFPAGCTGRLQRDLGASDSCEAEVVNVVASVVEDAIKETLVTMVTEVPVPGIWPLAHEVVGLESSALLPVEWGGGQGLRFYGTLELP